MAFLGARHQGLVLQGQFATADSSSRFLGISVLFKSPPQANFLDFYRNIFKIGHLNELRVL